MSIGDHGALKHKDMKAISAQVVSCCVFDKPNKNYASICMAIVHTCLTVGDRSSCPPFTIELHG